MSLYFFFVVDMAGVRAPVLGGSSFNWSVVSTGFFGVCFEVPRESNVKSQFEIAQRQRHLSAGLICILICILSIPGPDSSGFWDASRP